MITLSKVGNAIKFTFVDNGHYLFNGTIEVPVNSLSLVTDNSDMATFKKSATNDIFISGLYSEFGMSKSELETWYKDNMVGSSGGGGTGGTTPQEVQEMIDESISGKADTTAVTQAISSATDDMATETWVNEQDFAYHSDLEDFFDGAEYDSGTTRINFYHGNTVKAYIDASAFIVDGMIDNVSIETISGVSYLVIDFNTASGKEDIQIPLTDIFDPSNYYNKTEIDAALSGKADTTAVTEAISAATDDMATQTWVGEQGYITGVDLSNYATLDNVTEATSGKVDTSTYTAYTADTDTVLSGKQDTLIAGSGITISGNVISAEGGSGNPTVELTQAQYDALVTAGTVASDTYYIITDATPIAITTSITSGSTDSEVPSAKAVYDSIPTVTNTITSGSTDAVSSGAVYDVIGDIETLLSQI